MQRHRLTALIGSFLALTACATNPATGEKMLSLVSESQEIQMGQEYKQDVVASMGLVDDSELQAYFERIGQQLAAVSERPQLPWSFQVVDDPVVNAFALPGGPIFFTRGILAHFSSEAEMAAVMGHEIGHITARHSVEQISRQQLGQLGLAVGAIASSAVRRHIEALGAGMQVLFLSYGRDDEHQSDMLGVRYASRKGYDVRESVTMHDKLGRISELHGGGGVPSWLSTHPSSEDRVARLQAQVDTFPASYYVGARLGRDEYLRKIEGLVFGENPRNGFFEGNRFYHPDLRLQFEFPPGWRFANMPQAVMGQSPQEDALIQFTFASVQGHQEAARAFFSQEGLASSGARQTQINGLPAAVGRFQAQTEQGVLEGIAAFIDHGGKTYQVLGYAPRNRFSQYDAVIQGTIRSVAEVKEPRVLNVQPNRIELVRLDRATSIQALERPSGASVVELAIINGVAENQTIPAGTLIKWVTGLGRP